MKTKYSDFYKHNDTDTIWWCDPIDKIGDSYFSFDKKQRFSLFVDYPYNLTESQKEIFDKENPEWKDFFSWR